MTMMTMATLAFRGVAWDGAQRVRINGLFYVVGTIAPNHAIVTDGETTFEVLLDDNEAR